MSTEDIAQEIEARDWQINNRPRVEAPQHQPGDDQYGPEQCEECDEKMPPERRARGRHFCTDCTDLLTRLASRLRIG